MPQKIEFHTVDMRKRETRICTGCRREQWFFEFIKRYTNYATLYATCRQCRERHTLRLQNILPL